MPRTCVKGKTFNLQKIYINNKLVSRIKVRQCDAKNNDGVSNDAEAYYFYRLNSEQWQQRKKKRLKD